MGGAAGGGGGRLREMCASFLSSGVYKEDDRVLVMLREESERLARAETRDAGRGRRRRSPREVADLRRDEVCARRVGGAN